MANNTCEWYSSDGFACECQVETKLGTSPDDCFCPFHRSIFDDDDDGHRTKIYRYADIINVLTAERTRIASALTANRASIVTVFEEKMNSLKWDDYTKAKVWEMLLCIKIDVEGYL